MAVSAKKSNIHHLVGLLFGDDPNESCVFDDVEIGKLQVFSTSPRSVPQCLCLTCAGKEINTRSLEMDPVEVD